MPTLPPRQHHLVSLQQQQLPVRLQGAGRAPRQRRVALHHSRHQGQRGEGGAATREGGAPVLAGAVVGLRGRAGRVGLAVGEAGERGQGVGGATTTAAGGGAKKGVTASHAQPAATLQEGGQGRGQEVQGWEEGGGQEVEQQASS